MKMMIMRMKMKKMKMMKMMKMKMKMMKLAKPDEEALVMERKQQEMQDAVELRTLLKEVDENGDGTITQGELEKALQMVRIRHKFELLGVDMRDANMFFTTLSSIMCSDALSIDHFIDGCLRMKGPASSLDVQAIGIQVRDLAQQVACQ